MIIIDKIRFKNLNSVGNYWVEIPISAYKNILIVGKNGSAKTSVLQAITFALFGKPFTKIIISSLINSINKKGLETEIYFRKGNFTYKVIRGLKPDKFEIYENDILIKQDNSKVDYQKRLDTILGFDFNVFTKVSILASATYKPFMELEAKERRSLIEKLLDLEVFSLMSEISKSDLKEIKKLIDELDKEIYKIQVNITSKSKLQEEISKSSNSDKFSLNQNIVQIDKKLNENLSYKTELETKFKSLDINKYETIQKELEEESIDIKDKLKECFIKNKQTSETLKFFKENDICPICYQQVEESYKTKIVSNINLIDTNDLKFKESENIIKLQKINNWFNKVNQLKDSIKDLNTEQKTLEKEKSFYLKEIQKLEDKIIIDYSKELKELKKQLKVLEDKKQKYLEEKSIIDISLILLKDENIKGKIISNYVPLMNKLINEYLEKFNFFVKFELNENFEEKLKSRHIDSFGFLNFSEGEKARISLAILFCLREITKRKNRINLNLIGFDETLERVDSEAVESLIKILRSSDNNHIIISHNPELIQKFTYEEDLIIKVYKKGKFSYYDIGNQ